MYNKTLKESLIKEPFAPLGCAAIDSLLWTENENGAFQCTPHVFKSDDWILT